MPFAKLKLYPAPMVGLHRERSCLLFGSASRFQKIFSKDGNRPYCEDWSHIDNVVIEVITHMQQKIHRQALLEYIFLGIIKL